MKKISIIICLLMALCLLCACGSNTETGDGSAPAEMNAPAHTTGGNVAYEAHYYEGGVPTCIEQFDANRRLLSCEGDISDDYHYYEEYIRNDYAAAMDLSDLLAMDGINSAEATQVYYQALSSSDALQPQNTLMIFGYDENGLMRVIRLYYYVEGMEAPVLVYQVSFDLDENGEPAHAVKTAGNGELLFERYYENNYDNGVLMSAKITGMYYGDVTFQDGASVCKPLDEPTYFESAVEYVQP